MAPSQPCPQQEPAFEAMAAYLRGLDLPMTPQPRNAVVSCDAANSGYWNFGVTISDHSRLTAVTLTCPEAIRRLNAFLKPLWPEGSWNAVCVSRNAFSNPHRDSGNAPGSLNYTVGLGDYHLGELWLENTQGSIHKFIPQLGRSLSGLLVNTRHNPFQFSKDLWHATTPWKGDRWILTAYTMPLASTEPLAGLGFPLDSNPPKVASCPSLSSQAAACEAHLEPTLQHNNNPCSSNKLPLGSTNWGQRTTQGIFSNHSLLLQAIWTWGVAPKNDISIKLPEKAGEAYAIGLAAHLTGGKVYSGLPACDTAGRAANTLEKQARHAA